MDGTIVTIYYLREEFLEAIPRRDGGASAHSEQLREVLIVVYGSEHIAQSYASCSLWRAALATWSVSSETGPWVVDA